MADLKAIRREIELSDVGPPAILNSKTILALLDCAEALNKIVAMPHSNMVWQEGCAALAALTAAP